MPTTTKTKTIEKTRANAPDAAELFKKGQRILAGEDPTKVFPKETAAAPVRIHNPRTVRRVRRSRARGR